MRLQAQFTIINCFIHLATLIEAATIPPTSVEVNAEQAAAPLNDFAESATPRATPTTSYLVRRAEVYANAEEWQSYNDACDDGNCVPELPEVSISYRISYSQVHGTQHPVS